MGQITQNGVGVYKEYKGWFEGYQIKNQIADESILAQWHLIDNFLQDIFIIRNNLASEAFQKELMDRLHSFCENEKVVQMLFELELYLADKVE